MTRKSLNLPHAVVWTVFWAALIVMLAEASQGRDAYIAGLVTAGAGGIGLITKWLRWAQG